MLVSSLDIITRSGHALRDWIDGWNPSGIQFLIRAVLLFGLPLILAYAAFFRGSRSVFVQGLCLAVGVLLALTLPVESFHVSGATAKVWLVALCVVLLMFLPAVLPSFVAPTVGAQMRMRAILYALLVFLFLVNILTS
jgi:hypothetical protein